MKKIFKLIGLDCANCAAQLENTIRKVEGVEEASISFMTGRLVIEIKEDIQEEVIKKVKKMIKREDPDIKVEEI